MVVHGINLSKKEEHDFGQKIRHCLSNYIRRDCHVYLVNNHSYKDPMKLDKIGMLMRENDNEDQVPQHNKLVVVNLGWHDSDPEFNFDDPENESIFKESERFWEEHDVQFFFDSPFAFNKELVAEGEYVAYDNQNNHAMMTLMYHPDGYYVLYLLWDWMNVTEEEANGEVLYFGYWMNKLVKTACVEPIFYKKFCKEYNLVMKKPREIVYFNSIKDVATKNYPEGEKREALYQEMIDKIDKKTLMDCMTSIVFRVKKIPVNKIMLDNYLRKWAESKWCLYLLLGHNVTLSTTVSQKPDDKIKENIFDEILFKYPQYAVTMADFNKEDVINNRITNPERHRLYSYWPHMKNGMKFTKMASELFKDNDLDVDLSKIYQEKECDYQLSISINPMDYFTSSLSKSNWTSCHNAWDGCHSNAASSFMFDDSSLVAYACDGKSYTYEMNGKTFDWNSKIWRQMVSVGICQNSALFMREYPQFYYNGAFSGKVVEIIKDKICTMCGVENTWFEATKEEDEYGGHKEEIRQFESYYRIGDGAAHYNDIPARKTRYILNNNHTKMCYKKIVIGGAGICPICGKKIKDFRFLRHQACIPMG